MKADDHMELRAPTKYINKVINKAYNRMNENDSKTILNTNSKRNFTALGLVWLHIVNVMSSFCT